MQRYSTARVSKRSPLRPAAPSRSRRRFNQLNRNRIRLFDHRRSHLAIAKLTQFLQHFHSRFPQPVQRSSQIRNTERNVVNHMAARTDQWAGALARVDDQTDLAEPDSRRRRANHSARLAGRGEWNLARAPALRAAGRAEALDVPIGGAERRVAVQVNADEGADGRGVDLDQRAIRRFHISEQQPRSKSGCRRLKDHAIREALLVIGLHRRATPPEMPDGAVAFDGSVEFRWT